MNKQIDNKEAGDSDNLNDDCSTSDQSCFTFKDESSNESCDIGENSLESLLGEKEISKEQMLGDEIEKLKVQLKESEFKYRLSIADKENLLKRFNKEKVIAIKNAKESIILKFVGLLEQFDLGMSYIKFDELEPKILSVVKGFKMIYDSLVKIMKNSDVIITSVIGETFDPERHEAVASEEDSELENDIIKFEYSKLITLNNQILKPARVLVIKNKKKEDVKDV